MGKVARFLKRTLLALVAIVYGWLTPAHAIGPEFIEDTDSVIEAGVNNQRPVVLVFLAAYRANGPPASTPHDLGSIASNSERYASRIIYVAVVGASTYSHGPSSMPMLVVTP